jgi:hypothetical protein
MVGLQNPSKHLTSARAPKIIKTDIYLVASYSDASASSPGFTVTGTQMTQKPMQIYCDGQYFYWAVRLVIGNKGGN